MKYAYIFQNEAYLKRHYTDVAGNLKARLAKHNSDHVSHTAKFARWRTKTYIEFEDIEQAQAFERYLKSGYARAIAKNVCRSFIAAP